MERKLSAADNFSLAMGLVGSLILIFMWQANRGLANQLIKSESVVDIASAFFWLAGSVTCIYRIKNNSQANNFLLYFWAGFCFLCCAEELKWGYRIFNYSIESLQEINSQNDISFHNLILTGKWVLNPQKLFYLGFFVYFFIFPFLTLNKRIKPFVRKLNYTPPSIYFLSATWLTILLSVLIPHVFTSRTSIKEFHDIVNIIAENREMFCAFVVLSYIYFYLPAGVEVIEGSYKFAEISPSSTNGREADECLNQLVIQKNIPDRDQLSR
jgi:hypothetical protein